MKQLKMLATGLLLCVLLGSCTKNVSDTPVDPSKPSDTSAAIISGSWTVSSYSQRAENKTSQFAGAVFTFSSGGQLSAVQNGSTTSGTWRYSPSFVGYYGSAPTKASMTINMGTAKPMKDLNRTWNIVSLDATTLSLINPEPADDEHLVFTKQR